MDFSEPQKLLSSCLFFRRVWVSL